MRRGGEKASVFEIVGAWLHLWVPPRDVEIPPVPWRKLALWGAAGAVVAGAALAVLVPRIDQGKARRSAADAAAAARARAENHRRIVAEQAPRHGAAVALRPSAGAPPVVRLGARMLLVGHIEGAVLADAKARSASHAIPFPVSGPARCSLHPGTTLTGRFGVFDCFVVATRIKRTARNAAGAMGLSFRAVADFRRFTYTWCKVEGIPGEMSVPDPRLTVALPRACQPPDRS
jgi:hypothetical protein